MWYPLIKVYSYELPHRIYDTKIYPALISEGASIVFYASDDGLTVCWRGRKSLRKSPGPGSTSGGNGATSSVNLDSDDEISVQGQSNSHEVRVTFNPDNEGDEQAATHDRILCQFHINLETAIRHLAVPALPSNTFLQSSDTLPSTLSKEVVVLAGCEDGSVLLFTFAPSPVSTIHMVKETCIEGPKPIRQTIRSMSLTWTSHEHSSQSINDLLDKGSAGYPKSSSRAGKTPRDLPVFDLLVAVARGDRQGSMVIWRVPITDSGATFGPPIVLCQQPLASPATCISFNPARQSSQQHARLLVADGNHAVRLYDPGLSSRLHPKSNFSDPSSSSQNHAAGWLLSLHPPWQNDGSTGKRLRILDAQWALGGDAIMVLFANGDWAFWDIGCSNSNIGASKSSTSNTAISGGGVTRFALRGSAVLKAASPSLSGTLSRNSSALDQDVKDSRKLAPMTPNTRKYKLDKLFAGPKVVEVCRGGISVHPVRGSKHDLGGAQDESAVFWYGSAVHAIPSLRSYWQRAQDLTNRVPGQIDVDNYEATVDKLTSAGTMHLSSISTGGELITSVCQFQAPTPNMALSNPRNLAHDVLVAAEHRLIIRCAAVVPPNPRASESFTRQLRFAEGDVASSADLVDAELLSRNELDLGGIDRMLDGIGGDGGGIGGGGTRRLGFLGRA